MAQKAAEEPAPFVSGDSDEKDAAVSEHAEVVSALPFEDQQFLDNFTENQRKAVIRKVWLLQLFVRVSAYQIPQVDIRLVPILAFFYLIAYLDRANIGMI